MMKKYILILFALVASLVAKSQSQVEVHAVLDSSKIRIGEQTKLDIYLSYDASAQKNLDIVWPLIEDTLKKGIEVVNVTKIDTTIPDKTKPNIIQHHIQLTVTSFDSGAYYIAPFKFVLNKDTANPLLTEPLLLEVNTVPTDTSITKTKDIKPPYDEPFDWKWYINYLYYGLAILAFVIILILVIRKLNKKKPQEVIIEKPRTPAHVTALASLEKIKEEAIWKDNKVKEYYSSIADTVRLYIEERFHINALELTSEEIIKVFKSQVVDSESKLKLSQILTLSDFVKFAKQIPIEAEHTLTLNNAFDFVNGTLREEADPIHVAYTPGTSQNYTPPRNTTGTARVAASVTPPVIEKPKDTVTHATAPVTPTPAEKKKSSKKQVIGIIAGAIVAIVLVFIIKFLLFGGSVEDQMNKASETINKSCPVMVDQETRLDGTEVLPGKVFQYNYTLVNMSAEEIDGEMVKSQVEPALLNEARNNPVLKYNRDNDITMQYQYRDKSGKTICTITITPEQYK